MKLWSFKSAMKVIVCISPSFYIVSVQIEYYECYFLIVTLCTKYLLTCFVPLWTAYSRLVVGMNLSIGDRVIDISMDYRAHLCASEELINNSKYNYWPNWGDCHSWATGTSIIQLLSALPQLCLKVSWCAFSLSIHIILQLMIRGQHMFG